MEKYFIKKLQNGHVVCEKKDTNDIKKICYISENGNISWYEKMYNIPTEELLKISKISSENKKKFNELLENMTNKEKYNFLLKQVKESSRDHVNIMKLSLEEKINYLKNILGKKYIKEEDIHLVNTKVILTFPGCNCKKNLEKVPISKIKDAKKEIGEVEYIFAMITLDNIQELNVDNIDFSFVIPEKNMKEEIIGRCLLMNYDKNFCKKLADNWDTWINKVINYCNKKNKELIILKSNEYISDVFTNI